ncbi:MAG TPA: polysaccharide deacetylase family protein [Abditibacteriaceae bacterium]|jgi:peptidoglycan/xylan/chitin deacetylase (PgdA/CDA1 family)
MSQPSLDPLEKPIAANTITEKPIIAPSVDMVVARAIASSDAPLNNEENEPDGIAYSWRLMGRALSFLSVTALLWAAYFFWRPPGPMLHLKHIEHMGNTNHVSLTFDDAPHPLSTPLLLAALNRSDVKASFFVVGEGLRIYPELGYRMVAEGHALANHSENHRNLTRPDVTVADYDVEVGKCFERIEKLGQKTRLFRPPGGGMNRAVMQHLYDNNYTFAGWSNNIGDWSRPEAWRIVQQVNNGLKPGDVVLLHDAGIGTAQALPSLVREARAKGFDFVPMPEK